MYLPTYYRGSLLEQIPATFREPNKAADNAAYTKSRLFIRSLFVFCSCLRFWSKTQSRSTYLLVYLSIYLRLNWIPKAPEALNSKQTSKQSAFGTADGLPAAKQLGSDESVSNPHIWGHVHPSSCFSIHVTVSSSARKQKVSTAE